MTTLNKTRVSALVGVTAILIAVSVSPAAAETTHLYTGHSFGPEGQRSTTPFTEPQSIAVEQSTGDVYVYAYAESGGSVYKFNSSGEPVDFSALGTNMIEGVGGGEDGALVKQIAVSSVGPTKGDIYVASAGRNVRIYGPEGTLLEELGETAGVSTEEACGVAVDPAGHVYIAFFNGHVNEYTPTANPLTSSDYTSSLTGLGERTCNLAVDSEGSVYADTIEGSVRRYEASQFNTMSVPAIGTQISEEGGTLAVGPGASEEDLYIDSDRTSAVAQYEPSGSLVGTSGERPPGALSGSHGVAVYDASGDFYAAVSPEGSGGAVEIFGPTVITAGVSTASASSATPTGATLAGTVDPDGVPLSSCRFEYGTDTAYGQSVPCEQTPAQIGASDSLVAVTGALGGLQPGTSYHYRLTAGNANGVNYGDDQSFTTLGVGFGLVPGSFTAGSYQADGVTPDVRAGAHPYEASTTFVFNTKPSASGSETVPDDQVKDIVTELPAGFAGDTQAVPQCTESQLRALACSSQAMVGYTVVTGNPAFQTQGFPKGTFAVPIYNLVPLPGQPAQFGFVFSPGVVHLVASVRTGDDDGITITVRDITTAAEIKAITLTFWGVPSEHNGPGPLTLSSSAASASNIHVGGPSEGQRIAFLTDPVNCSSVPPSTTLRVDSWEDPGVFQRATVSSPALTDCDVLSFFPTISALPDTSQGDTPAGLTVDVRSSVGGLVEPHGLSDADIKDTRVVLPAGVVINPGQAAGLVACQADEDGVGTEGAPSCPAASKVGTVAITSPLLADKLEGDVYVLQSNPPNLRLLVAASADGVNVKLIGDVHLDEETGQLTSTFSGTPQLPFTDFRLSFSGGAQAALATPTSCGVYTTDTDFMPWSAPFTPDVLSTSSFQVASGPGGSACSSSLPFGPSLIAGATTDQAGGYSDFSLLLRRGDGQQRISTLQFKTPEGLLGMLSKVALCGEPQASQGTCPAASQIGHTVVQAGPGPYPLVIPEAGQPPAPIYLTGGYRGAPYGLSIAVPVIAGPFNLGTVVVRASIAVDRHTAQLTVTTDPLPAILDGVPTDLRTIDAVIDRPGFIFNPTNCSSQSFSGTAFSTEGARAVISSPFQVGSCQSLAFKPDFKISTSGKTSRREGASLDAKILYPTGVLGANQASQQANIASVKVDLPKQLPSRLTTLQKACPAAQFEANPAGCPKESLVGHATAVTPVLPVTLNGPAYFVSHGGEAFPSLIVVLQGYGVTVDLVGTTFISHAGITSSTFKEVPDVPITTFDLTLPEGHFSALAANGDLCKAKLAMPTAFVGQNGAVIHESTKISVTGCTKSKKLSRAQKLVKAQKACGKEPKSRRAGCEKRARKQYGRAKRKTTKRR